MKKLNRKQVASIRSWLAVTKQNRIHGRWTVGYVQRVMQSFADCEKVHYQFWGGSIGHMTLQQDGLKVACAQIFKIMGYQIKHENDASRGGAVGDYFQKAGRKIRFDLDDFCNQCGIVIK